jgi:hypothetical protein
MGHGWSRAVPSYNQCLLQVRSLCCLCNYFYRSLHGKDRRLILLSINIDWFWLVDAEVQWVLCWFTTYRSKSPSRMWSDGWRNWGKLRREKGEHIVRTYWAEIIRTINEAEASNLVVPCRHNNLIWILTRDHAEPNIVIMLVGNKVIICDTDNYLFLTWWIVSPLSDNYAPSSTCLLSERLEA